MFILNSLVFILIGLQLSTIPAARSGQSLAKRVGFAALIALAVILLRLLWVFSARYLAWWLARLRRRHALPPDPARPSWSDLS